MLELVLRLGFSLAAVLGLFWLVAHFGSRRLGGSRALLHVRARQSLSRTASVAVVEVGDRVLVVGVADGGVRLLTELDPDSLPVTPSRVVRDGGDAMTDDAAAVLAGTLPGRSGRLTDRLAASVATRLRARSGPRPATVVAAAADLPASDTSAVTAARVEATPAPTTHALNGSVLSTQTWKQAWASATARRAHEAVPSAAVVFTAPSSAGTVDG